MSDTHPQGPGDDAVGTRDAALAYAALGWSVIPIEPHGKRPRVAWTEFQRRAATPDEIAAWFQRWPDANVGIVTGRVSGVLVVDVDPRHGGEASLAALERAHGPRPPTVEALTGGGGRHLYFAHPGGVHHNRVALAPGIDLRGDGGCVVAPPSLHASGRRYAWAAGGTPFERAPAAAPGWCLADAASSPIASGSRVAHWREVLQRGADEGTRNATLASLAGHLLWHGVDAAIALELLLAWNRERCRPPLDDHEVEQVVRSIARLHARERQGGPTREH